MNARSSRFRAHLRTANRPHAAGLRAMLIASVLAIGLGPGLACGDGHEATAPADRSGAEESASADPAAAKAKAEIQRSHRPAAANVYFIDPVEGQTVESPITVRFGLGKMGVAPAGVDKDATGHHHLIVDATLPPLHLPIPSSENYRHFGAGQTQVELDLEPGEHTLQLLLGDHLHMPHLPPVVSERITITVK